MLGWMCKRLLLMDFSDGAKLLFIMLIESVLQCTEGVSSRWG